MIRSKMNNRKIADVRRDVWKSGFTGLFYGSVTSYTLHTAFRIIHDRFLTEDLKSKVRSALNVSKSQPIFTRNTAALSFMVGGALGSFLMATSTGKNEVHELHDIFHINEKKKNMNTPYQQVVEDGKINGQIGDDDESADMLKQRMLSRRKTISSRLDKGRGLSDSHGGHWVDEEKLTMTQEQRGIRRRSMTHRLEQGRGLSDSHSGKWKS